ncbi:MAG TPA: Uma2 family endonuclease [Gemmatimonadaceae bacterium]|nr:Uma2 family endonuclease [Gemmatimonadaceae bacterium]
MAVSVPRYTVDDLEHFPDDGNRYELLDGLLLVTPAPRAVHQVIASRLQMILANALAGRAQVVGPGAICVPPGTQLQPDVLVYPSRFGPMVDWAKITEHWLAVEVLSRSSRFYDREFKRDAYFALGVPQVWLVDYADRSVEVCRPRAAADVVRDVIRWRAPTLDLVVPIDLAQVFAGVE